LKKKILYIWKDKYPWDVRVEKVCKALLNAGYEVFMLARNKGETTQKEIIDGLNITRVGEKNTVLTLPIPQNPIWKSAIKQTVREIKPDLIIVREIMLAEDSAKIGKKNSIPTVIDMAENYPAAMRDWRKYNKNFLLRFIVHSLKVPDTVEKRAVQQCDGIIIVCDEQIERLYQQYKFPASKTCVVHNTPNLSYFENVNKILNKNTSNSSKIFCHHGNLSAEKSITNLLLGFEIAAENKNIELIIAGSGECENEYKELVSKFRNKNKFQFLGSYSYQDLPQILAKSDFGVIPYQINDFNNYTIHNKVFDYFAMGKPVLASIVNPLIRILNETKAGLALDFTNVKSATNAIDEILKSDYEKMSKNAFAAAQTKYNWDFDAKILCDFVAQYIK